MQSIGSKIGWKNPFWKIKKKDSRKINNSPRKFSIILWPTRNVINKNMARRLVQGYNTEDEINSQIHQNPWLLPNWCIFKLLQNLMVRRSSTRKISKLIKVQWSAGKYHEIYDSERCVWQRAYVNLNRNTKRKCLPLREGTFDFLQEYHRTDLRKWIQPLFTGSFQPAQKKRENILPFHGGNKDWLSLVLFTSSLRLPLSPPHPIQITQTPHPLLLLFFGSGFLNADPLLQFFVFLLLFCFVQFEYQINLLFCSLVRALATNNGQTRRTTIV